MAGNIDKIRTVITADNKQFVKAVSQAGKETERFSRRLSNTTSASRQGDLALIELGRGVSDVRFGFHGAANNAQRMIEIFAQMRTAAGSNKEAFKVLAKSLIGPGALVAGLSAIIAFGPEIYSFFEDWISGASDAEIAQKALNDRINEGKISVEEYFLQQQIDNDKIISTTRERLDQIDDIEEKQKRNGKTLQSVFVKERDELDKVLTAAIATNNELINGMQNASQSTLDAYEALKKYQRRLKELKDQEPIKPFSVAIDDEENPFSRDNVYSLFGINPNNPTVVPIDDILWFDFDDIELFGDFEQFIPEFKDQGEKLGDAIKAGIASGLTGLAQTLGEVLAGEGDFGGKLLAVIGTFMQALGGAFISIGIAKESFDKLIEFFGGGTGIIIAGAALVIAGSALSSSAASSARGSATGGGASALPSTSAPDLRSIQGSGSEARNVGGLSTRDGDVVISADALRQAMQASERKYNTLAG